MRKREITVEELAQNMRSTRMLANPEQVEEGRTWYGRMRAMLEIMIADAAENTGDYGVTVEDAAGIVSSMSMNTSWADNVERATRFLNGLMPDGRGHLPRVMAECEAIANGADPLGGMLGIKRTAFARNLSGDESVNCSDRWELRSAFALDGIDPNRPETFPQHVGRSRTKDRRTGAIGPWYCSVTLTDAVQAKMQAAAEIVAAEFGETVAAGQAIRWIVTRGSGE